MESMAELELELDLGGPMRKAMIAGLADIIDAMPTYRYAVILELLRRDALSRVMIAEAIGEEGLRVTNDEAKAQQQFDVGESTQEPDETTWDEIATRCIAIMQDSPGGRGEVE
jgi:hypothetical protein